jgi:hypothetical protein
MSWQGIACLLNGSQHATQSRMVVQLELRHQTRHLQGGLFDAHVAPKARQCFVVCA